ncbi:hypothetical protein SNEBB_001847 [Seison nebaliae]|nr:hypothetical protein SNEBB_001847 [Seison nebaliae]
MKYFILLSTLFGIVFSAAFNQQNYNAWLQQQQQQQQQQNKRPVLMRQPTANQQMQWNQQQQQQVQVQQQQQQQQVQVQQQQQQQQVKQKVEEKQSNQMTWAQQQTQQQEQASNQWKQQQEKHQEAEQKQMTQQQPKINNPCINARINDRFPYEMDEQKFIQCGFGNIMYIRSCPPKTKYVTKYAQCTLGFELEKPCSRVEYACKNGGICHNINQEQYQCECKQGFTGIDCSENVDDCVNNPCGMEAKCVDLVGGYVCLWEKLDGDTLIGENMNQLEKVKCTVNNEPNQFFPVEFNERFYYQCTPQGLAVPKSCHVGYFWNKNEMACLDTPEEVDCKKLTCNAYQVCRRNNETNMAECVCKQGRTGEDCMKVINFCEPNPCASGGICLPYSTGFNCMCPNNFIHSDCSLTNVENPCRLETMQQGFHIHPYPSDKQYFIKCFPDLTAAILSCPKNTIFSAESLTCISQLYIDSLRLLKSQQEMQKSLPKKWVAKEDPLRIPTQLSENAKLVPFDSKTISQQQYVEQKQNIQQQQQQMNQQKQPQQQKQQQFNQQKQQQFNQQQQQQFNQQQQQQFNQQQQQQQFNQQQQQQQFNQQQQYKQNQWGMNNDAESNIFNQNTNQFSQKVQYKTQQGQMKNSFYKKASEY